jgi:hypothetical protein
VSTYKWPAEELLAGEQRGETKNVLVASEDMKKPKYMGVLWFRDIEHFNLALLAMQAWRIIHEPSSLCARILKAVYFPNGEFLKADVGASPSRIWRAIIDERDMLKQGLTKRIGTGEETYIWNTNWLPRDGLLRPIACLSNDGQPQLVRELIDPCTATWDMEKIQWAFLPMDADIIRNIPLSTRRQNGFWA